MSSPLPCGTPSAMSKRTTSPSSFRPTRWASVPPICPAPISAILLRAIGRPDPFGEGPRRGARLFRLRGGPASGAPGPPRRPPSAPLRRQLLQELHLDLLDLGEPLPLLGEEVVDL